VKKQRKSGKKQNHLLTGMKGINGMILESQNYESDFIPFIPYISV
jgi:hypothetical protein